MALKVIGVGLGRTGTLSLKLALEQLGFGPCYHMTEVLMDPSRGAGWVRAAEGQADWDAIFTGFESTVDYPGCGFWRELAQYYPTAKVLLSVRDPQDWFDSTQATIFSDEHNKPFVKSTLAQFFSKTVFEPYGSRIHDRDFVTAAFQRHNAEVQRDVPANRLLVYEVKSKVGRHCASFSRFLLPLHRFPVLIRAKNECGNAQRWLKARMLRR